MNFVSWGRPQRKTEKSKISGVLTLLLFQLAASTTSFATIYGEDSFTTVDPRTAPSVAIQTLFFGEDLVINGMINVSSKPLADKGICESESWSKSIHMGHCTGTKVFDTSYAGSDEYIITAGHCVPNDEACAQARWVFPDKTFEDYPRTSAFTQVPASQVAYCDKVVARVYRDDLDYALVRIKKVPGFEVKTPAQQLTVEKFEKVSVGQELYTLSYPLGTSLKRSVGMVRKKNESKKIIETTVDGMRGTSGALVYASGSNKVVGIFVRGDRDYEPDLTCNRLNRCPEDGCRGEEIIPIEVVLEDIKNKIGISEPLQLSHLQ